MKSNCIFCNPEPSKILFENDLCYSMYDNYPVSPGHILIIPKDHFNDYFCATEGEMSAMNEVLSHSRQILYRKNDPDGYNIGINIGKYAGQTVEHCHIHLIPRYKGDVRDYKGGVRGVIPEKRNYIK